MTRDDYIKLEIVEVKLWVLEKALELYLRKASSFNDYMPATKEDMEWVNQKPWKKNRNYE